MFPYITSICYYRSGSAISVMLHEGLMLTQGRSLRVNINPEGASFPMFFASSPSTAIHGSRNRPKMQGKSGTIIFLSQETVREKALRLDQLFHREWSQKQCVEGTYPLWSDMHCNSRLVANLIPFWRVVTRQFTVHCYLSVHTWCSAT